MALSAPVVVGAWTGLQPTSGYGAGHSPDGLLQTLSHKFHRKIDDLLDMHDSQGGG